MNLSSVGAIAQGLDYQFLLVWRYALEMLLKEATKIEVEAPQARYVDDIVVHWPDRVEYIQVKFATDGRRYNNSQWWTQQVGNQKSLLQKFWSSWLLLKGHEYQSLMTLYTNRPRDPNDVVMKCISGLDNRLFPRFAQASPLSSNGKERKRWAKHLDTNEQSMLAMIERLYIRDGQGSFQNLVEGVGHMHMALGLRDDHEAVSAGVNSAREWVKNGKRVIDRADMEKHVQGMNLNITAPQATLLVQEIRRDHFPDLATVSLDWMHLIHGEAWQERRYTKDPQAWNDRMMPELIDAASEIERQGYREVFVPGYMRLPSWFAVGRAFADVAGWRILCKQNQAIWDSGIHPTAIRLKPRRQKLQQGSDLAISLSVSANIRPSVKKYIEEAELPVGVHIDLEPLDGVSHRPLSDGAAALGWARAVRDAVRKERERIGDVKLHLFMAVPGGAAMLLGHIWNRVPATLVYADLDPGYAPTYEFRA